MSSEKQAHNVRAAAYREKREQEGLSQTQIWLSQALRAEIDERIRAGEFRNRSEAISAALTQMIQGGQSCNP